MIGSEVYHHRNAGYGSGLYRVLNWSPFRTGIMSGLDAHDHVFVPLGHIRGGRGLHIRKIVLELRPAHSVSHDIQKRQDARFGAIDDALFEVFEIPPPRATRVRDCCHAYTKHEAVGIEAVVSSIRTTLAGARVHVDVNVNQAWRHV